MGGSGVAAGLAACGTEPLPAAPPPVNPVVMIVRHAEKPPATGVSPKGIDVDGNENDHALTPAGWVRAGALAQLFGSGRGLPQGLSTPTRFYASQGDTKSLRPMQTLSPLAALLGSYVITKYSRDDVKALAAELRAKGGVSLIAWESDALPTIPAALGPVDPPPPAVWPNDRFDVIWVLTGTGTGWKFSQVPQMLLAGDRPTTI
ncbi:MAG TPA: hypothetical protein VIQ30_14170 [Pseudonocardia sp.]|jgi:hypothetical protein